MRGLIDSVQSQAIEEVLGQLHGEVHKQKAQSHQYVPRTKFGLANHSLDYKSEDRYHASVPRREYSGGPRHGDSGARPRHELINSVCRPFSERFHPQMLNFNRRATLPEQLDRRA